MYIHMRFWKRWYKYNLIEVNWSIVIQQIWCCQKHHFRHCTNMFWAIGFVHAYENDIVYFYTVNVYYPNIRWWLSTTVFITVTSRECHSAPNYSQYNCLFISVFMITANETLMLDITDLLWGESTTEFPPKGSVMHKAMTQHSVIILQATKISN